MEIKDLNNIEVVEAPMGFFDDEESIDDSQKKEELNNNPKNKSKEKNTSKEIDENETDEDKEDKIDEEKFVNELFSKNDNEEDNEEDEEDNEEDEEEDNDKDEVISKNETPALIALNFLKKKGVIEFETEEDHELTENEAEEILEDKFDESIENRIEDLVKDLPDVVKQLNKFVLKGGKPEQFFETILKEVNTGLSSNIDIENEQNQELVMKKILTSKGYDEEYISTQIEFLKDSNRLGKIAKQEFELWKKQETANREKLLKKQEEQFENDKIKIRKEKLKLSTKLDESDTIGGIKLSKQDKKDLPSYILEKNIKLTNGGLISQFHKDVLEAISNQTTAIQLAKLLKSRNKDGSLSFKNISEDLEDKIATKVRNNIQRNNPKQRTNNKSSRKKWYELL